MFEVNRFYHAQDSFHRHYYLWVLQLALSGTALRGIVYDSSYRLLSRRWFRVSTRGNSSTAYVSDVFFKTYDLIEDSTCIPPEEVLDYFRNEQPVP